MLYKPHAFKSQYDYLIADEKFNFLTSNKYKYCKSIKFDMRFNINMDQTFFSISI